MAKTKTSSSKQYSYKKKDTVHSVQTEDIPSEILHGNTIPHSFTAWGRTHTGGGSSDENSIVQDVSIRLQAPGTSQAASGSRAPGTGRGTRHRSPVTGHRALGTEYRSPSIGYLAPGYGHWVPVTRYRASITRHQTPGTRHSLSSEQSQNIRLQSSTNRQRLLLPLDPDFTSLSDVSISVEPPRNTLDFHSSSSRKCSSRRDLSSSKHQKWRRYSSTSFFSSSSPSSSSPRRSRRSKRPKHSHRKRRHLSPSSYSSESIKDYHRY